MSADPSCGFFPAVPEAEACKGPGGKQLFKKSCFKTNLHQRTLPQFAIGAYAGPSSLCKRTLPHSL